MEVLVPELPTLTFALGLLVVGPLVIRVGLFIVGVYLPGVASLLSIAAALCVLPVSWQDLLILLVPFALGFFAGTSTRINRSPGNPLSMIYVPPYVYDQHQEMLREFRTSRECRQMMSNPHLPWSLKMHLALDVSRSSFYRFAPLVALFTAAGFIFFWLAPPPSGTPHDRWVFPAGLGIPFGWCIGTLVTYIRGRRPRNFREFQGTVLRPTWNSFARSVAIALLPLIVVAVAWYFLPIERKTGLVTAAAISGIVTTCWLLITTVQAHRGALCMADEGIAVRMHGRLVGMRWNDLTAVTLRERYNLLTGRDRLLILHSANGRLAYPLSVLSDHAQQRALSIIRRAAPMSTKIDIGSL